MKPVVPIMFRMWRGESAPFAMFPTLPGTNEPHTCTIYQHIGQHSSGGVALCIANSRPARVAEYKDLLNELTQIYHDCELRIVQRESSKMRDERYAALQVK